MTSKQKLRIAVIESMPVLRELDASSRAMADLLDAFTSLGHQCGLWLHGDDDVTEQVVGFAPDVIVLSRPPATLALAPRFRSLQVPLIYFGHDLHHVRIQRESELLGRPLTHSRMLQQVEKQCCMLCDYSVFPGPEEGPTMNTLVGKAVAGYFPYFCFHEQDFPEPRPSGKKLIFVGGSNHGPNVDGVLWFLEHVWHQLRTDTPDVALSICGLWTHQNLPASIPEGVAFTGALSELHLSSQLQESILSIAPLRYGAGIKRKIVQALAAGLPTVTTSIGAEGLHSSLGMSAPLLIADSAEEWIAVIKDVLRDSTLRRRLSLDGKEFVARRFGTAVFLEECQNLLTHAQQIASTRIELSTEPSTAR